MRRVRPSVRRPLPWAWCLPVAAIGLLGGQAIGAWAGGGSAWVLGGLVLMVPAMAWISRAGATATGIGCVLGLVGVAQVAAGNWLFPGCLPLLDRVGQVVQIEGRVVRVAASAADGRRADVLVRLERIDGISVSACSGRDVLIFARSAPELEATDWVAWAVRLRAAQGPCNAGVDPAQARWRRRGVAALGESEGLPTARVVPPEGRASWCPRCELERLRERIGREIDGSGDPGAASVLRALVIGDPSRIPQALRDAYARSGTAHVISVSGLHLTVVLAVVHRVVRWLLAWVPGLLSRGWVDAVAALVSLGPALFYCLLAGAEVAAVRSLVMGALLSSAVLARRRSGFAPTVAAAALVVGMTDRGMIADPSFQLSFASVVAIVAAGSPRAADLPGRSVLRTRWERARAALVAMGLASSSATLGTAPFTIHHMGMVSWIGVLANPIVIPLVGTSAVVLGLAGAVLWGVSPGLGALVLGLACDVIAITNPIVGWAAGLPLASLEVGAASRSLWAMAAAGAALAALAPRRLGVRDLGVGAVVVAAAALLVTEPAAATAEKLSASRSWRILDTSRGFAAVDVGRELVIEGDLDELEVSPAREALRFGHGSATAGVTRLTWIGGGDDAFAAASLLSQAVLAADARATSPHTPPCFESGAASIQLRAGQGAVEQTSCGAATRRSNAPGPNPSIAGELRVRTDGQLERFSSCRTGEGIHAKVRGSSADTDETDGCFAVSALPRPCDRR